MTHRVPSSGFVNYSARLPTGSVIKLMRNQTTCGSSWCSFCQPCKPNECGMSDHIKETGGKERKRFVVIMEGIVQRDASTGWILKDKKIKRFRVGWCVTPYPGRS
ncbi:hypothetical protein TNIN_247631 [Trichonephila inaurata madagascariensis]|uniref:Uncharacterized protein n=1 Tax=Trichonephila inaurata madagascariensis TaxID=2747483 RepID=A0A8X6Y0G8_9ARAC|nr:hypothetical protein TNIN_247631 [Trichonephila inaurata madagascariensis]